MKCRAKHEYISVTRKELKELITKEISEKQDIIINDCSAQFLAVALACMEVNYGFGEKRLNKFVDDIVSSANMATNGEILGKIIGKCTACNAVDLIDYFRDKYGIDCREIIKKM